MLLFTVKIIPPPCTQGTRLSMRLKRHRGDIYLQKYEEILKRQKVSWEKVLFDTFSATPNRFQNQ